MPDLVQLRQFGSIAINLSSGEVQKNGRKLKLQEQPFQVLAALLERPGEVVTREELRQRVWPANTFVDFNNGLNIAIVKLRQALNDDAAKPRYIETLPRRGYRFIALPEEIGPQASEIAAPPEPVATPAGPKRRTLALAVMATVTLTVIGLGWAQFFPPTDAANPVVSPRPSAAVIGFRNLGGNPADEWLSVALAEMLSTELAAGDGLSTIPGESVARARIDLALPDADSYSAGTLERIHKDLAADYVIVGSYINVAAGVLRLDVRLQDTRTGQTLASIGESGTSQNLPTLVAGTGLAIRQKLNLAAAGQADVNSARAAIPARPDTARLYAEGLALLRRYDAGGARIMLEQAVAADPGYAMAHAALARAWSELGYGARAKEEAKRAWQLSSNLPRTDRLAIEGAYRLSNAEWEKAARIFGQLHDHFPDQVDYPVQMAGAEVKAGNGKSAMAAMDRLPAPLRDDPAIGLMQSLAAEQAGDFQQAQSAAAKAAGGAQSRGSQMLVAEARAQECRMLRALGRSDPARAACETARQIYAAAGNRRGVATVTGYLAAVRADEGDLTAAKELYAAALAIDREIGDEGGAIWELNGLADVLWSQGDLAGATRRFEESLAAARKTASPSDQADALDNIAVTSLLAGDLSHAREMFEQALASFRAIGDKSGIGNTLGNLGEAEYLQGDLARSTQTLDQAVALNREAGNTAETADVLAWSGRVLMARGDLAGADRRYRESLRIWQEMGSPGYVARHRLRFAELAIESGRPGEAESPIHESLAVFEKEKQRDAEMEARTLLVRALVDEGKAVEARREIDSSASLAKISQNRMMRLAYQTAAAQALAASGKPADGEQAIRRLQPVIADAVARGFVEYQLQARLVSGSAEIRMGRVETGRAKLKSVEQDARTRGYITIARKASAIITQPGVGR